jgi:chromosome segregation ATPase
MGQGSQSVEFAVTMAMMIDDNCNAVTAGQILALQQLVQQQQVQLREAASTILDLEARLAEGEAALQAARQATDTAAGEMDHLNRAAHSLSEHDVRSRKLMANQVHDLKQALRASNTRLRQAHDAGRRHNQEYTALLHLKAEELAAERTRLSSQFMSQVAAIHAVERASAQVEVAKVKMELDAYKEPWVYTHGNRPPTRNSRRIRDFLADPNANHDSSTCHTLPVS